MSYYDLNARPPQPGQPWQTTQGSSQPWPPQQPPPPPAQWSTQPQWQQPGPTWPPRQPMPPQPPKRKRRIWLWIVGVIVVIGLCNAVSHATQSNTPQASAEPTQATSNAPIVAPEARLGSPLSTFDTKFGSREAGIDDKGGSYTWHTNYGDLDLSVETLESVTFTDTTKNLVPSLLFSFPYSSDGIKVLSNKAATELALPFLPKDAVHVKDALIQSYKATGEAILVNVYTSASLAKTLPTTAFVDSNGQQGQAGLITIVSSLENDDKNQISDVTVQAGDDLPGGYDSSQITSPPASPSKSAVTAPTVAPQPPKSQPTQPPTPTYNTNPSGGQLVYNPPADFCANNACVSTFWTATNGYVVECANGEYSHSGGVRGACSRDGGVAATLYQH